VNCHNPHSPKFPGREPAPGPHLLHAIAASERGEAALAPPGKAESARAKAGPAEMAKNPSP